MVVPESTGNLNFKTNMIILGCLNPHSSKLLNEPTVNTGDVLADDPGLFVFLLMLLPQKK
jgi:hypothetical protein